LNSLALARQAAGHIDAARSAYDQAIDIGRRLVDELPKINTHAVTLGAAYCNRAHLEQEHADHTATLPWYSEAIQTLSTALARDAADAEARKFLLNSYRGRAKAFTALERYDEAIADWDRVIELDVHGSEPPLWERVFVEVQSGEYASATVKAQELARGSNATGRTHYNAARALARASAAALRDETRPELERQKLADQYAGQALEFLRAARQRDYFTPDNRSREVEQHPDFTPLRSREDFQKWCADLP